MKPCSKCGTNLPPAGFYKEKRAIDGLTSQCRDCFKQRMAANYQAKREAVIEKVAGWQADNPHKVKGYKAKYRSAHREELRAASAKYHAENRAHRKAVGAAYRMANPEKARAASHAWHIANREANREYTHARRARLRGVYIERVDIRTLFKRDGGTCGICRKPVAKEDRSVDHILPLVRGGEHSYTNTRLAHWRCNISRRDHGPAQLRMTG